MPNNQTATVPGGIARARNSTQVRRAPKAWQKVSGGVVKKGGRKEKVKAQKMRICYNPHR